MFLMNVESRTLE